MTESTELPAPNNIEITEVEWWEIEPSHENDKIYGPVDPKDPSIIALAQSIREFGLRDPIVRVLDMERFEAEQRAEEHDAAGLKAIRVVVQDLLKTVDLTKFTEGGAA